jgi:hypothetical protein
MVDTPTDVGTDVLPSATYKAHGTVAERTSLAIADSNACIRRARDGIVEDARLCAHSREAIAESIALLQRRSHRALAEVSDDGRGVRWSQLE